jgi:TonB family protein
LKKITLLFVLFGAFGLGYAQKKQNVYLLKKSGKEVSSRDSADFVRVIEEPDSGSVLFKLMEFHKNGKIRTMGSVSKFYPRLSYEGQLVNYDENGTKRSVFFYEQNRVVDKGYYFYANGKINRVVDYGVPNPANETLAGDAEDRPLKIEYFADSLGNVLVNDGTGHYKETTKLNGKEWTIEGDYKAGLKDGSWTQTSTSGDQWYKEKFLNGKLLSGESFKDGQTNIYAVETEQPSFKGGISAFYDYLSRAIRYPFDAQTAGVQGKVFLSFIVEKDGNINDIRLARNLYPSLDDEAIRVLKASPKWIPGKSRGIPERVKYNIPIIFSLRR